MHVLPCAVGRANKGHKLEDVLFVFETTVWQTYPIIKSGSYQLARYIPSLEVSESLRSAACWRMNQREAWPFLKKDGTFGTSERWSPGTKINGVYRRSKEGGGLTRANLMGGVQGCHLRQSYIYSLHNTRTAVRSETSWSDWKNSAKARDRPERKLWLSQARIAT